MSRMSRETELLRQEVARLREDVAAAVRKLASHQAVTDVHASTGQVGEAVAAARTEAHDHAGRTREGLDGLRDEVAGLTARVTEVAASLPLRAVEPKAEPGKPAAAPKRGTKSTA